LATMAVWELCFAAGTGRQNAHADPTLGLLSKTDKVIAKMLR